MTAAMTKLLWWAVTIVGALLLVAQLAAVGFGRPLRLYDPISGILVVLGVANLWRLRSRQP
jgi:uncharacterized membrane protein